MNSPFDSQPQVIAFTLQKHLKKMAPFYCSYHLKNKRPGQLYSCYMFWKEKVGQEMTQILAELSYLVIIL